MKYLSSKVKILGIIVGGLLLEIISTCWLQKVSENWAISQCGPICELEGLALFGTFFFGGYILSTLLLTSLTFLGVWRVISSVKYPILIFILLALFYFFPGGLLSLFACNPM